MEMYKEQITETLQIWMVVRSGQFRFYCLGYSSTSFTNTRLDIGTKKLLETWKVNPQRDTIR